MPTIGIVSDTHVPDKVRCLNPRLVSALKNAGVEAILHAGDISGPEVIDELGAIAPVYAVRGNRDWLRLPHLPLELRAEFGGVRVGLAHGHGGWRTYLLSKLQYLVHGYRLKNYLNYLLPTFSNVDVIVFGHSHNPENLRLAGKLIINPGSTCISSHRTFPPSYGLLQIQDQDHYSAEIIPI